MTARTISTDMPDFPDTVRLTQEAPGMVGDTIAGTRVGVRHTRRRYAATLAALIAASAVVAGCTTSTAGPGVTTTATSGSSTATTTTTATATATPSATTAPTAAYPADVPAEARANTPDGAKAFAKHYFAQINKAYTTPASGPARLHCRRPPARRAQLRRATQPKLRCTDSALRSGCRLRILEVAFDSDPPDKAAGVTLVDVVPGSATRRTHRQRRGSNSDGKFTGQELRLRCSREMAVAGSGQSTNGIQVRQR